MGELRKDYILDRWVLIVPKRGERPNEFVKQSVPNQSSCFFCPGHESLTPSEIGRIGDTSKTGQSGGWRVRWFENKFPAVAPHDFNLQTHNRFFTFGSATGVHEVIVETPDHRQLAELSEQEIAWVLEVYGHRIDELSKHYSYVSVFKNSGPEAGTSLIHSHSQLIATHTIPKDVRDKCDARRKFVECPYCAIIATESKSERRVAENSDWVAFCPYASRFNGEVVFFPKHHITSFNHANYATLAPLLKKVLSKVSSSYNLALTYSPVGEDLHVHLELLPRASTWGGFELGSGTIINTLAPEDAAAYYRGKA